MTTLLSSASHLSLTLSTFKTIQEISKFLRSYETDVELKIFYADVTAYCAIIHGQYGDIRREVMASGSPSVPTPVLFYLESILRPRPERTTTEVALHELNRGWDSVRVCSDDKLRSSFICASLDFGTTQNQRKCFIQLLAACEEGLRAACPQDQSHWTIDDANQNATAKISEPSYAVWNAAQSILKALIACKNCPCNPAHDFGARLCLGTYRKPDITSNRGDDPEREFSFDMFLSLEQDWHEAHIHTTKETTVQFVVEDNTGQHLGKAKKQPQKALAMRVKRLCEPIARIRTMAAYRLELRVKRGQLFKLQSERSTSLVDKAKDPISLQQVLASGPHSFTEKTRRILAVLLSSAVLHLHDTNWLQPSWSSANVLFFPTVSSAIPLKPFIDTKLPEVESQLEAISNHEHFDSEEFDPDDFDPDDLVPHHCPTLVSLAIMLMEVFFATPFSDLAARYLVNIESGNDLSPGARYINADLVFKTCRDEIPEYSRFRYALEKCLDPTTWEDENGDKLDQETLRTRIYKEVVQPLEIELSQAYSSIPIDDLDRFAQNLNFAHWDQSIQLWSQQIQAEAGWPSPQDPRQEVFTPCPRSASPYCSPGVIRGLSPANCAGSRSSGSLGWVHESQIFNQSRPSPESPMMAMDVNHKTLKFFDDEAIPDASDKAYVNISPHFFPAFETR